MSTTNRNKTVPPKQRKGRSYGRLLMVLGIVGLVMLVGVGCGFFAASLKSQPDIEQELQPNASSQIYDINGIEIANIHATENRLIVKLPQIPLDLQNAFIAVEDNRFYEHHGVDVRGILRAAVANVIGGGVSEGGSTITQQLVKNAYLSQERTLRRKIKEIALAIQMERQYTKREILEMYLNQIYFGQGAYGVQAAAKTYFGKDVHDLDTNECAMLAGIPKSPNYYSPFNDLDVAEKRKAIVLDQMAKYSYLTADQASKLKQTKVKLLTTGAGTHAGSYFVDFVTQELVKKFGANAVYKEGLKIYTTLDIDMQRAAEQAIKLLPNYGASADGVAQPQGAIVAIDPHTGQIKAMVGGRGTDQFNRATMAERQPGSAFKPFVFITALENHFTPSTVIEDSPITIGDWSPMNYSRNFNGKVTLRYVAEQSLNVPTVKVAQRVGIDKVIYYAQEMGISTFVLDGSINDGNLATAIGGLTKGVTPLELTSAYGTFANKGVHVDYNYILKVVDRNGNVLMKAAPKQRSVVSENSAAMLNDMLQGAVQHGTGGGAIIGRPMAGKTGTTDDSHDAWFVGYTPDLVAGVWVGCDDNEDLGGMTGGLLPATIWRTFMSVATAKMPVTEFDAPTGYRMDDDKLKELPDDRQSPGKKGKDAKGGKGDRDDGKETIKDGGGRTITQDRPSSETSGGREGAPVLPPPPNAGRQHTAGTQTPSTPDNAPSPNSPTGRHTTQGSVKPSMGGGGKDRN